MKKQFSKFLDAFKKLHINIPFVDALEQIPSYVKFIKEILSNKRKLKDSETVKLTEECSVIFQNKMPQKLKDPGSFTIPCTTGTTYFDKALCDLGVSANLMSLSMYKKLDLGEAKATIISLQLSDRFIKHPQRIIEDVLLKVDNFIFPTDFIMLDLEEDEEIPIIPGLPFLAIGRTLIDEQEGELILRFQDEKVIFNVFKAMKYSIESNYVLQVDVIEEEIREIFDKDCPSNPLEACLVRSMTNKKPEVE